MFPHNYKEESNLDSVGMCSLVIHSGDAENLQTT